MTKEELIKHLQIQHGFRDQVDDSVEEAQKPGSYGIIRLDHPVWMYEHLKNLHEQDHQDYPDTGTPVRGWAHRHKV